MNMEKMNQWLELARQCSQDDFWDGFMDAGGAGKSAASKPWTPLVDIYRTELQAWVWVELPGVLREELHVSFAGDSIVIKGAKSNRMMIKDTPLSECYTGAFERSVHLPFPVDWTSASAKLSEGILLIRLALLPAAAASRIPVE